MYRAPDNRNSTVDNKLYNIVLWGGVNLRLSFSVATGNLNNQVQYELLKNGSLYKII